MSSTFARVTVKALVAAVIAVLGFFGFAATGASPAYAANEECAVFAVLADPPIISLVVQINSQGDISVGPDLLILKPQKVYDCPPYDGR